MMGERETDTGRAYGVALPGHRLPEATRLGPVRLQVSDLERSRRFYVEVLGFDARGGNGAATLSPRGEDTAVIELRERRGAAPVPPRGRLGLYHYAILVPDRAALGRLARHLGDLGVGIGASDHLVSEALYLGDPDGLGIEVYADRPRSAWGVSGQELAMSTRPLDLAGLNRAAGEEPWSGMPPGTRIGHVHLHVGDLERAAAFYHEGLGLDKTVWSYPGALFLSAGGYHHHLGLNTWAAGAAPPTERDARLLEWEIVVPEPADAEAAAGALKAAGHDVAFSDGGWTASDPWGTTVRVRSDSEAGV